MDQPGITTLEDEMADSKNDLW